MNQQNIEAEFIDPKDFVGVITQEVDDYFVIDGYDELWLSKQENVDPEKLKGSILNRLMVGYYNELYIRDAVMETIGISPDVKTQQALLQQVQDEHKHAMWIEKILQTRGYDPRYLKKSPSKSYNVFWDYLFGRLKRAAHSDNPLNFLNVIATTQLVNERLFGLRATASFADSISPYDEEIAVLYGDKIRKDEIFHTINLPEMILEKHATSPEAQQAVREGVESCKPFLRMIVDEMKLMQSRNYDNCKI